MKIIGNWKLFIIVLNLVVVGSMVSFVIYSTTIKNDLVEADYYQKGLKYQKQIDKIERSAKLNENVRIEIVNSVVNVYFPKMRHSSLPSGKINFYRPSAKEKDFSVPVSPLNDNKQSISFKGKDKGMWIVKIDWSDEGFDYYYEEEILIY